MPNCAQCNKKVGFVGSKTDFWGNHFCSDKCKDKFKEKKKESKEMVTSGKIKELKCTCNQCKHVWHYLDKDEKSVRRQAGYNAMIGCGMCCNPFGAYFSNKAIDKGREADKFSKCPKCGSGDIKKSAHYYDKKD